MQILVSLRWPLLIAAFACALVWVLPMILPALTAGLPLPTGVALYGAAPLQAIGVFAMSRSGARGWPMIVGYAAVVSWLISLGVATLMAGQGPGAGVYGILIMLPAMDVAAALELVAMIGFALRKRSA